MMHKATEIPKIDFRNYGLLVEDTSTVPHAELSKLADEFNEALSTVGYLVLVNHGVSRKLVDETLQATKTFFELPEDAKTKCANDTAGDLHGWIKLGQEGLGLEGYSDPRECFASRVGLDENGQKLRRAWPEEKDCPRFKETMTKLFHESLLLSRRVLEILAIVLDVEDKTLFAKSLDKAGREGGQCGLLASMYPAVQTDKLNSEHRLSAHTDYGMITLVYPATSPGLQFFHKMGDQWIDVPYYEDGIILHVADLLQRWSADKFHSVRHRVVVPKSPTDQQKPRQSLVFFGDCDGDTVVTCYDGSNKYPPVVAKEYILERIKESQSSA